MKDKELSSISEGNHLYMNGEYPAALDIYRKITAKYPALENSLRLNIYRCEQKLEARQSSPASSTKKKETPKTIALKPIEIEENPGFCATPANPEIPEITVTLTTIKSRLTRLKPVIESLHNQKLQAVRIELNISSDPYLLDHGIDASDDLLAGLNQFPLLKINWVANIGPYRKIWPLLERHFSQTVTCDKIFVTVDDDTIYPDYFLQTLYESYLDNDCIIAFRGRHIEVEKSRLTPYNKWTWGQVIPSLSNLPTGKDGILYHTKFFTKDFLLLKDALEIAPTADDLWIKWHCAINGVPSIILNPEACSSDYKSFPVVDFSSSYRSESLYAKHNSSASHGKNDSSVEGLEKYYFSKYGYNLTALLQQGDTSC